MTQQLTEQSVQARAATGPVLFRGDQIVEGEIVDTTTGSGQDWADDVVARLGPGERAVVALPFRPDAPGVAHRVRPGRSRRPGPPAPGVSAHRVVERPDPAGYADRVRRALELIEAGRLQKVVLGRGIDVFSDPPLDPDVIVDRLIARRPGRFVFRLPLDGPGHLVGASPELLVRRQGTLVTSLPLAGSVPRDDDPDEDRRRAATLRDSTKDLTEHAFVVDAITTALRPLCGRLSADERPRLVSTDTLHHLGTRITALLNGNGGSALHLAQLLHPTPAVGGVPQDRALQMVDALEDDRGLLTGAVGWVDGAGNGEFAVTIRSGVLQGNRLRLFAGAGIVAGSDPEAEVRETGAKLATMLRAVGL